ncbi:hypothetical protein WA026_001162 [Henosepilachna vigintioctopunctata]|uniref:Uncharacterized protein n=1 Tax=Henosepilachna vigintioctopunctata TaxID=420089 RepID=A0AAW1UPK6_9CUCU
MNPSSGPHAAMAIQRQRRLWEEKAPRRSSAHPSSRLISRGQNYSGMLHVGVCCLVVGLVLTAAGTLPYSFTSLSTGTWQKELMATGIMVLVIGIYLIILYPFMNKCEDKRDLLAQNETEEMCNIENRQQNENVPIVFPKQNGEFTLEKIEEEDMSEREETKRHNLQTTASNSSILDNRFRENFDKN